MKILFLTNNDVATVCESTCNDEGLHNSDPFAHMQLALRPATMSDAKLLFDWANDPNLRANSLNQEPIEYNGHVKWLKNKLSQEKYYILIAMAQNAPIGLLRIDANSTNALLSFSVDKNHRSKGLGTLLLKEAIKYMMNITPLPAESLLGIVKKCNIASRKAFLKAGFCESQQNDLYEYKYLF